MRGRPRSCHQFPAALRARRAAVSVAVLAETSPPFPHENHEFGEPLAWGARRRLDVRSGHNQEAAGQDLTERRHDNPRPALVENARLRRPIRARESGPNPTLQLMTELARITQQGGGRRCALAEAQRNMHSFRDQSAGSSAVRALLISYAERPDHGSVSGAIRAGAVKAGAAAAASAPDSDESELRETTRRGASVAIRVRPSPGAESAATTQPFSLVRARSAMCESQRRDRLLLRRGSERWAPRQHSGWWCVLSPSRRRDERRPIGLRRRERRTAAAVRWVWGHRLRCRRLPVLAIPHKAIVLRPRPRPGGGGTACIGESDYLHTVRPALLSATSALGLRWMRSSARTVLELDLWIVAGALVSPQRPQMRKHSCRTPGRIVWPTARSSPKDSSSTSRSRRRRRGEPAIRLRWAARSRLPRKMLDQLQRGAIRRGHPDTDAPGRATSRRCGCSTRREP